MWWSKICISVFTRRARIIVTDCWDFKELIARQKFRMNATMMMIHTQTHMHTYLSLCKHWIFFKMYDWSEPEAYWTMNHKYLYDNATTTFVFVEFCQLLNKKLVWLLWKIFWGKFGSKVVGLKGEKKSEIIGLRQYIAKYSRTLKIFYFLLWPNLALLWMMVRPPNFTPNIEKKNPLNK
jgi:hypothetical protein